MNRYDHHFRSLPAIIRMNAAQKVGFARGGIIQHRCNGFGPEDDDAIVRQFDLSGMAEFWDIVLSEPMPCEDFIHALAVHFLIIEHKPNGTDADRLASGPAASRAVDIVKAGLRSALRQARIDGEPWFIEVPEPLPSTKLDAKAWLGFIPSDVVILPPDPPSDGVYLSKLKVRPRAAVEWLVDMPKRRHLVPTSLVEGIRPQALQKIASPPELQRSGAPGRPTSMHLVEAEMVRRSACGALESSMALEAGALASWLERTHPAMPALGKKRIQNALGAKYRSFPK